jgi:hypothetical protein
LISLFGLLFYLFSPQMLHYTHCPWIHLFSPFPSHLPCSLDLTYLLIWSHLSAHLIVLSICSLVLTYLLTMSHLSAHLTSDILWLVKGVGEFYKYFFTRLMPCKTEGL